MLRSVQELYGLRPHAADGDVGAIVDLYFDAERWGVRYLLVQSNAWLPRPQVLISPLALGELEWDARRLTIGLTWEQIAGAPPIDTRRPIARRDEIAHDRYYRWPHYWRGAGLWGARARPPQLAALAVGPGDERARYWPESEFEHDDSASHLYSTREIGGYRIDASDGAIGRIEDTIVDLEHWAIRYLVVDASSWLPGKKVLVAQQWVARVDRRHARVAVDLPREMIQDSPEFDPSVLISARVRGGTGGSADSASVS